MDTTDLIPCWTCGCCDNEDVDDEGKEEKWRVRRSRDYIMEIYMRLLHVVVTLFVLGVWIRAWVGDDMRII